MALEQQFISYAKFGDPKADGKSITLSKSDRWLKQADILDDIKVTYTETGVIFSRFKCSSIHYQDFLKYIHMLCTEKELQFEEVREQLIACGPPGVKDTKSGTQPAQK